MLCLAFSHAEALAVMGEGWRLVERTHAGEFYTRHDPESGELFRAIIALPMPGESTYAVCVQECAP
jgi:hypothetical protein